MSTMASASTANDQTESSTHLCVNSCNNEETSLYKEKDKTDEGYQGPHDWRKILRPVEDGNLKSLSARSETNKDERIATNLSVTESENKAIKDSRKIHNEDSKLNEKPKRVPSWKRHLIEKKKNKVGRLVRNGSGAGSQDGGSGVTRKKSFNRTVDSTFKQQVVNSNNLSQSNSFRRRISPSNSFNKQSQGSSHLTKNRIEKVQRARLYLLQQNGPNSFLIGGDSPDHKFRVIIGPQTCSCGKSPHCVHVLFVMLRVFQVQESDPSLWSRTLKNYEVENLFRIYQDKVSSRISKRKKDKESKKESSTECTSPEVTPSQSEIGSVKEEEDTCPICLLEMLEGESLLKCENGCQNRLHHHCIAVWFELCRRQKDPLICPLCRAKWKTNTIEVKSHEDLSREPPGAPPNTRAPSPQPQALAVGVETRLPYADPVPDECREMATPWIEVFGEDLVSCFFAKNWSIRESALNHLSKEVQAVLMRGMGEGRSGVLVSPERQTATHRTLECCCQILAFMCNDPVYRVYVASLRTLRTILSYTPCRENHQKIRIERLLKSIVDAVVIKCTDGTRRTSQLSLSTIVEVAKGQDGELAIGKEIHNSGGHGLHGLDYIIKSVTEEYNGETVAWQWLLGRLYVLERLFEEFHNELLPRNPPDGRSADEEGPPQATKSRDVYHKPSVQDRLLAIAKFAIKGVTNSHMRISRMARRVFLLVCRFSAHIESLIDDLEEMLTTIDTNVGASMKKRLWRIVDDFQLSEKIVQELHHGIRSRKHSDESPYDTPVSTPRCNSPITYSDSHSEASSIQSRIVPLAPPNTPIHERKKQKSKRTSSLKVEEENFVDGVSNKLNEVVDKKNKESVTEICSQTSEKQPPPIPPRPSSRRGSYEILETGPILTPPPPISRINSDIQNNNVSPGLLETDFPASPEEVSNVTTKKIASSARNKKDLQRKNLFLPLNCDANEEDVFIVQNDEDSTFVNPPTECNSTSTADLDVSGDIHKARTSSKLDQYSNEGSFDEHSKSFKTEFLSNVTSQVPSDSVIGQDLTGLDFAGTTEFQYIVSSDEKMLSSDDSLDRRKRSSRSRFKSSDEGGLSSDELLNFDSPSSKGTPNREDRKVSFRSEVTSCSSPKHFPDYPVQNNNDQESCLCKEEIEKEEAIALAKALEVSGTDPPTPKIPGLTPTEKEEVITIKIQPNDYSNRDSLDNDHQPKLYLEGVHWRKGPLLGTGAYSTCYQSRDVKTGVIMAVKQISFCRNNASEQEKVVETISEEIQMMAKLNHPNVVRILGATKQGCHFNMFLEWMPGGSISYLLSQYGIFSEDVMISYIFQTLRGLAYLHDNHILHRDLKGANLLVDSTGQRLRIGDFGAAARLASQTTGAGEFQGQLLGTIAFMAPEVLRGEEYGRACDVWSTGCVIIEMSSSNPPWDAKAVSNHLALIFKIATSMTPPPIPESLSPPIKDLALRCLEQDKKDRPSAKDLLLHPVFTSYKPIR